MTITNIDGSTNPIDRCCADICSVALSRIWKFSHYRQWRHIGIGRSSSSSCWFFFGQDESDRTSCKKRDCHRGMKYSKLAMVATQDLLSKRMLVRSSSRWCRTVPVAVVTESPAALAAKVPLLHHPTLKGKEKSLLTRISSIDRLLGPTWSTRQNSPRSRKANRRIQKDGSFRRGRKTTATAAAP